jgi:hypothetical protein
MVIFDCIFEKQSNPMGYHIIVRTSENGIDHTQLWFHVGIKAQKIFELQATENRGISKKRYANKAQKMSVKRGDYIVNNAQNVKVG